MSLWVKAKEVGVLAAGVGVVHQAGQVEHAALPAGPDGVLERVEHEFGGHAGGGAPAHDHPGEHVDDEGDVDRAGPGRDIGEIGDPQLVRRGRGEVPVDQIRRPVIVVVGDRGADLLGPQRAGPALFGVEPLDRAAGDVGDCCTDL